MLSILFVEDDASIAMGVEYSLKQDGFHVSMAYRLEEARDLLKRQPFELVLALVANQGRVLTRAQGCCCPLRVCSAVSMTT